MTNPTDEELDGFIKGYLLDGEDWWYDEEIVRGLARALLEHFGDEKDPVKQILNDPNDELIENVLKWADKVLDGVDLNEKLPDEDT